MEKLSNVLCVAYFVKNKYNLFLSHDLYLNETQVEFTIVIYISEYYIIIFATHFSFKLFLVLLKKFNFISKNSKTWTLELYVVYMAK